MKDNKISSFEVGILMTYLLKAFVLINGINILISLNKNDSIISILIGFFIGFIILYCFNSFKDSIFNNIKFITKLILMISVLIFSSYLLYSISFFVKLSFLNNVDILPISILLILAIFYLAIKGIETICKSGVICFYIFIFLEIISVLFLIPSIDSIKILPFFENSFNATLNSSLVYTVIAIFPIFLLLSIPKNKINVKKKKIKLFYIASILYTLFNFILVFSIIDVKLAALINYPELFILSKISMLNFFDRMEKILIFKFLFDSFFTISLCLFYINEGVKSITSNKKIVNIINVFSVIIILFISNYVKFNNKYLIIPLLIFGLTNIFISLKNEA